MVIHMHSLRDAQTVQSLSKICWQVAARTSPADCSVAGPCMLKGQTRVLHAFKNLALVCQPADGPEAGLHYSPMPLQSWPACPVRSCWHP